MIIDGKWWMISDTCERETDQTESDRDAAEMIWIRRLIAETTWWIPTEAIGDCDEHCDTDAIQLLCRFSSIRLGQQRKTETEYISLGTDFPLSMWTISSVAWAASVMVRLVLWEEIRNPSELLLREMVECTSTNASHNEDHLTTMTAGFTSEKTRCERLHHTG